MKVRDNARTFLDTVVPSSERDAVLEHAINRAESAALEHETPTVHRETVVNAIIQHYGLERLQDWKRKAS